MALHIASGYSQEIRFKIINRLDELEELINNQTEIQSRKDFKIDVDLIATKKIAISALKDEFELNNLFKIPEHIVQQESVKRVKLVTGVDFSDRLLLAPAQNNIPEVELMLEPTELGKLYNISGRQMNLKLADAKLQIKVANGWEPTEFGKPMCTKHSWIKGSKIYLTKSTQLPINNVKLLN